MNLQDALFNWLQMKVVSQERPDDEAALDTLTFFDTILKEDHFVNELEVIASDDQYVVRYNGQNGLEQKRFDREFTDKLLHDIQSNPKYNDMQ